MKSMRFWGPLALALSCFAGAAPAQDALKIGFMGTLSGPQGVVGQDQYDAFMLVVERQGGKLGGMPVEILREDDQMKPEVARQAVSRLIDRERVSIITGISMSNVMMAVYPLIAEREVFLIGSNASPSPLAGAECSPYIFITSGQGDQAGEVVGKYASDQGYERLFALAPNYQAGKGTITGLKRFYEKPLAEEAYTPLGQMDFSAELTQLAAAQPQAAFAFYPGGMGVNFAKQYQQAGLVKKIPLLSTFVVDATTLPAIGDVALGMLSGSNYGPDLPSQSNQRFVQEFEKKYGRIPSSYAAQSYDAALLLDSAIAKVKGKVDDKPAFMKALKSADFDSVRGHFEFNNNNFPIQDWHILEVAKDAQGRLSLKTIATPLKAQPDAYHKQCPLN